MSQRAGDEYACALLGAVTDGATWLRTCGELLGRRDDAADPLAGRPVRSELLDQPVAAPTWSSASTSSTVHLVG